MDAGQHADQPNSRFLRGLVSFAVTVALILGLSYVLRTYVIQGYAIPSGSMEETIMTGDTIFSERVSYYMRDPAPGDIITFQDPEIPNRVLIKRCIAVGGQTVDMRDGALYIDGVLQDEPYTNGALTYPLTRTLADISYPYTVPQGSVWVMGDNRMNSQDSRYFGPIPQSTVMGRAFMVYWPLENFGILQ